MIVYIAGKITGDNGYEFKFIEAERSLESLGFTVLNPARLPEKGMEYEQYLRIGQAMIDEADIVYLLPDYKDSPGAMRELEYAKSKEKIIIGGNYK